MSKVINSILSENNLSISSDEIMAAKMSNNKVTMAYCQNSDVNQPLVMVAHEIDGQTY